MVEERMKVEHLSVSYDGNPILNDISFSFGSGKLIGILGPNGAGKSTLIKAMLGLIPHDRGTVVWGSQPLKERRRQAAYVPQRSNIDWNFPIRVKETVLLGTYPNLSLFQRPKKEHKEWAIECLRQVGMEQFQHHQIGELSGGQQQRVFLARALAQKAMCFFLDEPFVGIDVASEEVIIRILKQMRDEGKTIFVVHHDLSKVQNYFDHLILINKELIGSGEMADVFLPELMERAYRTPFTMMGQWGASV